MDCAPGATWFEETSISMVCKKEDNGEVVSCADKLARHEEMLASCKWLGKKIACEDLTGKLDEYIKTNGKKYGGGGTGTTTTTTGTGTTTTSTGTTTTKPTTEGGFFISADTTGEEGCLDMDTIQITDCAPGKIWFEDVISVICKIGDREVSCSEEDVEGLDQTCMWFGEETDCEKFQTQLNVHVAAHGEPYTNQ